MDPIPNDFSKRIVIATQGFEKIKRQLLGSHIAYQNQYLQRMKFIDCLHSIVMYNYELDIYEIRDIPGITFETPKQQQDAWLYCCKMKYTAGYPIVYSLTSLPAILEDTILGKEHKGLVLFEQTPIVSKTLFYDVVGDKFEPNEEASKRMKAFSHIQLNMAATIFQPPVMN